jgi:arylsulfatase A-like enzyme
VILVTLDALRADHTSIYGYERDTTPQLRELSREFCKFVWAFAPSSFTAPSHASILTGKYPSFHEIGFFNEPGKARLRSSLPSTLRDLGYRTGAFVSTNVLNARTGLDAGFEHYDDECTLSELNRPEQCLWRRGTDTLRAAEQWLHSNSDDKCFLWIHLMDAHGPYSPPPPYDQLFVRDRFWREAKLLGCVADGEMGGIPAYQVLRPERDSTGALLSYERDWNYYVSQYDGSVRYVDDAIGHFFHQLKKEGHWDDSLLIVTADHGEAMGENQVFFFHSLTVTMDQIRVPLLVKAPKNLKVHAKVAEAPVSTVDILPTILETANYDYHFLGVQGISLCPQLTGRAKSSERYIFSETEEQCSLVTDRYQYLTLKPEATNREYVFALPKPLRREMLFEYTNDPLCLHGLSGANEVPTSLRPIAQNFISVATLAHQRIRGLKSRELEQKGLSEQDEARMREHLAKLGYE